MGDLWRVVCANGYHHSGIFHTNEREAFQERARLNQRCGPHSIRRSQGVSMAADVEVSSLPWESRREYAAIAWDMEGALGLPFVVRENGDVAIDPEALDKWWTKNREAILAAYDQYHPATPPASEQS